MAPAEVCAHRRWRLTSPTIAACASVLACVHALTGDSYSLPRALSAATRRAWRCWSPTHVPARQSTRRHFSR